MTVIDLKALKQIAFERLADVEDGDSIEGLERCLIEVGLALSVTSLDPRAIDEALTAAFEQGATVSQIQEVASLVSGLGVHSLMASAAAIAEVASRFNQELDVTLDEERQALWDRYVGADPYWKKFETAVPGFLAALVRLSPGQFAAFFDYCALPWITRHVPARTKELVSLACDATPAHRFLPGFTLHLDNAIAIGVGREAIMQTLEIAASAPSHCGYP